MFDESVDTPPPLQHGDQLFINNQWRQDLDNVESYAYQGYKIANFTRFSLAYYEAASRLVQTTNIDDISDALVLPIVFLYRHYVELTLKNLVSIGNRKFGNPPIGIDKHRHKIDLWWKELKPLLQKLYALEKNSYGLEKIEEIDALEACLLEFSRVDEDSMAFRYPINKRNIRILTNNAQLLFLEYIDVHHLAEKMESIHQFFLESYAAFVLD